MVKCYTYGVSTKLKYDVVLKSSINVNDTFFEHIGIQEIGRGDNLIDVMTEFDTKSKLSVQGKHKAFIFLMIQKSSTWRLLIQEKFGLYPMMKLSITVPMKRSNVICGLNLTRRIIW
jgi:hypothetical protein